MTKRLSFALTATAALALAACSGGNQDEVTNADLNATEINAEEAVEIANESETLENQAAQLENEVENATEVADPAVNQGEADVAVNGM